MPAVRDFERAHDWLARSGRRRAEAFVRRVQAGSERLEEEPLAGPLAEDIEPEGTLRSLSIAPHRLLYRATSTTVTILRVWDSRRDPATLLLPADATEGLASGEGEQN